MNSITRRTAVLGAVAALAFATVAAGCSSAADTYAVPRFDENLVDRQYAGIAELANISSAIVVVTPTGESFSRTLPGTAPIGDATPPVPYVRLTVVNVLAGSVTIGQDNTIDLVSPGTDANTGQLALLKGASCLLFIAPAMLGVADPFGGYVVSGGPNGVFCQTNANTPNAFVSAFAAENETLPETLTIGSSAIPPITHTEAELIAIGPQ